MGTTDQTIQRQKKKCRTEAYSYLRKAAEESVFYVAEWTEE